MKQKYPAIAIAAGVNIVVIVILLKKSFSENQKKIFRTQMLYIARSELG
jgi:hypothetical protein